MLGLLQQSPGAMRGDPIKKARSRLPCGQTKARDCKKPAGAARIVGIGLCGYYQENRRAGSRHGDPAR